MKILIRLLSYARPIERFALPFFVFSLLASFFGIVNFTMLMPIFDILFDKIDGQVKRVDFPEFSFGVKYLTDLFDYFSAYVYYEFGGKVALLYGICIFVAVSVFLSNLFRYLTAIILENLKAKVVSRLRQQIFDKTINLDLSFFSKQRKGNIISHLTTDIAEVESSITTIFKVILKEPLLLLFYFIVLFSISVQLTLFVLIFIPLAGGLVAWLVGSLKRQSRNAQQSIGNAMGIMDEAFGGIKIVQAFNAENYIKNKFHNENNRYANLLRLIGYKRELASPVSEFMGVSIILAVLVYGGILVIRGNYELKASEFIAYLAIFSQVTQPIKEITNLVGQMQRGLVSAERVFQLMDTRPAIVQKSTAIELKSFSDCVVFENVRFSYRDNIEVLKGINFTLQKGKTIALVGASGGGKSTIADLLPRFYDPTLGAITIDGISLRELDIKSLRSHLGIVSQEPILFNDTIFENIAFGSEVSMEQVAHAAKIANAHDFIMQLPEQYQTNIGDRGGKLSGGQRQRISIARAILKNPSILILDEATSALDNESEKLVQEALDKLMQNRTSIVIAHRLSTIRHADEILVVHQGQIVERGTHEELLLIPQGVYHNLYHASLKANIQKKAIENF